MTNTELRYIPKGSAKMQSKDGFCVVYFGHRSGKFYAIGYHGKAVNRDFHYSFNTEESRAKYVAQWLQGWKNTQARKEERKSEKKAFKHSLQVGSVLSTCWGYDQTNIEYFEVTKLIGNSMVEVREIAQESEETSYMSGKCVPVPGNYVGKPLRKRVLQGNRLDIHGGFGYASLETPKEVAPGVKVYGASHWSSYA